METSSICFLPKPKISPQLLKYISDTQKVYANLCKINLIKELNMYQYPFSTFPEINPGDSKIRCYLFKSCKEIRQIYGECFISGESLFTLKKISESKILKCSISIKRKKEDYTLTFQKVAKERKIRQEDIQKDPLTK